MKKVTPIYFFLFVFLTCAAFLTKDTSNDCVLYFPWEKGTEFELRNYDKKGKLANIAIHKVTESKREGNTASVKANFEFFEKENDPEYFASGDYSVKCEDGVFHFEFGQINPMGNTGQMRNVEMDIESDFLDIPANPQAGQTLNGGKMVIRFGAGDMNLMKSTATISNRKVAAVEKRTTPAGTFDCIKITYDTEVKMLIKAKGSAAEWYAKDVGLVRSESYDKKGKLIGYTELHRISK